MTQTECELCSSSLVVSVELIKQVFTVLQDCVMSLVLPVMFVDVINLDYC